MTWKTIRLFVMTLVLGAAGTASAQVLLPQQTGYVGLSAGYADPSHLNGRFGFGADFGLKFTNGMTGLLYFLSSSASESGVDTRISHYGVGADYNFAASMPGLRGGLRVGLGSAEVTGGGSGDSTRFSIGPALGYDHPINESFTFGAETQIQWTMWEETRTTWYALANVKLWF